LIFDIAKLILTKKVIYLSPLINIKYTIGQVHKVKSIILQ